MELRKHKIIRRLSSSHAVKITTFAMFLGSAGFLYSFLDQRLDPSKVRPVLLMFPGMAIIVGIIADIVEKFSKDAGEPEEKIDIVYVIAAVIVYIACGTMALFFMDHLQNWPQF